MACRTPKKVRPTSHVEKTNNSNHQLTNTGSHGLHSLRDYRPYFSAVSFECGAPVNYGGITLVTISSRFSAAFTLMWDQSRFSTAPDVYASTLLRTKQQQYQCKRRTVFLAGCSPTA